MHYHRAHPQKNELLLTHKRTLHLSFSTSYGNRLCFAADDARCFKEIRRTGFSPGLIGNHLQSAISIDLFHDDVAQWRLLRLQNLLRAFARKV